ncbi:hypothetical protein Tco_0179622 [Tanacetum coccineum]
MAVLAAPAAELSPKLDSDIVVGGVNASFLLMAGTQPWEYKYYGSYMELYGVVMVEVMGGDVSGRCGEGNRGVNTELLMEGVYGVFHLPCHTDSYVGRVGYNNMSQMCWSELGVLLLLAFNNLSLVASYYIVICIIIHLHSHHRRAHNQPSLPSARIVLLDPPRGPPWRFLRFSVCHIALRGLSTIMVNRRRWWVLWFQAHSPETGGLSACMGVNRIRIR